MNSERVMRLVFGEAPDLYDKRRPGWPLEMIKDIIDFTNFGEQDAILEVGAGTGKASVLLALSHYELIGVEPDAGMVEIARQHLEDLPNASIEISGFEEWPIPRQFALLASAQAWHWVDSGVRLEKASKALREGGAIALFWNAAQWDLNPIRPMLDEIYAGNSRSLEAPGWGAAPINGSVESSYEELRNSKYFDSTEHREYPHVETYKTQEYLELLLTDPEHRLLDEDERTNLFAKLSKLIDENGGVLELEYKSRLLLARRNQTN